jgi:hypothetical protein
MDTTREQETEMTKIRAYGYKESCNCFLPRDILDALGEKPWVRQGEIVVFASTAAAAFHHLAVLGLKPYSIREVGLLHGRSPEALIEADLGNDGEVYAQPMSGNLVASVTQDDHGRLVDVVGKISSDGVFVPVGAGQASNVTPRN